MRGVRAADGPGLIPSRLEEALSPTPNSFDSTYYRFRGAGISICPAGPSSVRQLSAAGSADATADGQAGPRETQRRWRQVCGVHDVSGLFGRLRRGGSRRAAALRACILLGVHRAVADEARGDVSHVVRAWIDDPFSWDKHANVFVL